MCVTEYARLVWFASALILHFFDHAFLALLARPSMCVSEYNGSSGSARCSGSPRLVLLARSSLCVTEYSLSG